MENPRPPQVALAFFALVLLFSQSFATFAYLGTLTADGENHSQPYNAFKQPFGIASDGTYLYVSDALVGSIFKMSNNTVVKRIGSSGDGDGQFTSPKQLTLSNNKLFIADSGNNRIQIFYVSGQNSGRYDTLNNGGRSQVSRPGAALEFNGDILAIDSDNNRIVEFFNDTLNYKGFFGVGGQSDDGLKSPQAMIAYGNRLYVADTGNDRIKVYDSNYSYVSTFGIGKNGVQLSSPDGMAVYNNLLFVADTGNNRIVSFTLDGFPVETFGSEGNNTVSFEKPTSIAFNGSVAYVADSGNSQVKLYQVSINASNSTVLSKINDAAAAAQAFQNLSIAANSINISVNDSSQTYLVQARASYAQYSYSDSFDAATTALATAQQQTAALNSLIAAKIRLGTTLLTDTLASLATKTYPAGFSPDFASAARNINTSLQNLDSADYTGAINSYVAAQSTASLIAAKATTPPTPSQDSAKLASLKAVLAQANAKFTSLQSQSNSYHQNSTFDEITAGLAQAETQLDSGNISGVESLLNSTEASIDAQTAALSSKIPDINSALKNITQTELQINATRSQGFLLVPDLSLPQSMIAKARSDAYSDPQGAMQEAQSALAIAQAEPGKIKAYVLAGIAVAVAIGIVAFIGVFLYIVLHFKRKRRKGRRL